MILVDDREDNKVFKALEKESVPFEKKRLLVGDFVCYEKSVCVEHKTVSDFVSSFQSSRLQEQLLNMQTNFENNYVVITGEFKSLFFHPHFKRFTVDVRLGMLASLTVRYSAKLIQVDNVNQLVKLVQKIVEKTNDGKTVTEIKRIVKTDSDVLAGIIAQVPLIGWKRAKDISVKYKSLNQVQRELFDDTFTVKGVGGKGKEALKKHLL